MNFEQFLQQLADSEAKCKLAFNKWFTKEQWSILKRQFITVTFHRGDRKCTLVIRK